MEMKRTSSTRRLGRMARTVAASRPISADWDHGAEGAPWAGVGFESGFGLGVMRHGGVWVGRKHVDAMRVRMWVEGGGVKHMSGHKARLHVRGDVRVGCVQREVKERVSGLEVAAAKVRACGGLCAAREHWCTKLADSRELPAARPHTHSLPRPGQRVRSARLPVTIRSFRPPPARSGFFRACGRGAVDPLARPPRMRSRTCTNSSKKYGTYCAKGNGAVSG